MGQHCIKAIIKDNIYKCPKCREIHKIETPEDMPIMYDIIDIIRVFTTMNFSTEKNKSCTSGATNKDVCNIHYKVISHWCNRCHVWICDKCLDSHSTLLGCSTANLEGKKEEHLKNKNMLLAKFEKGANYVSNEIKQHKKLVEEYTKLAEKHADEEKKFQIVLEEGNSHKENFEEFVKKQS